MADDEVPKMSLPSDPDFGMKNYKPIETPQPADPTVKPDFTNPGPMGGKPGGSGGESGGTKPSGDQKSWWRTSK